MYRVHKPESRSGQGMSHVVHEPSEQPLGALPEIRINSPVADPCRQTVCNETLMMLLHGIAGGSSCRRDIGLQSQGFAVKHWHFRNT